MGRAWLIALGMLASCVTAGHPPLVDSGCCTSELPFVHQELRAGGALLFIGTRHTSDAKDPQLDEIARLWSLFSPTLVLNEGGNPRLPFDSREEAVQRFGEMGFVRWMATQRGVTAFSADPSWSDEIAFVSGRHSPKLAKVFYAIRAVPVFKRRPDGTPLEARVDRFLSSPELTALPGPPRSADELDQMLATNVWGLTDWRNATVEWTSPQERLGMLNEVGRTSSLFREAHMTKRILEAVSRGERVLVVAGRSHLNELREAILTGLRD